MIKLCIERIYDVRPPIPDIIASTKCILKVIKTMVIFAMFSKGRMNIWNVFECFWNVFECIWNVFEMYLKCIAMYDHLVGFPGNSDKLRPITYQ
jgi:hypothetical protein